ncbi:UPF0061 protein YdiU [Saliniradius amylolyticus]|uniref:Protein nucleotidyltransferase YdiU n=1 Tax=Saliniradius amylolyticus TaxID=2183582 RepID=A0A2S2E0W6_9ALTE|nr:YdiU family protein [Saliniradius amylolyticus]AWL10667.1 UPF0061 protein YdiU [Saliniradius amylolyticus]
MTQIPFQLSQSYAQALPEAGTVWPPAQIHKPRTLYFNDKLARQLHLPLENADSHTLAQLFSGNAFRDADTCFAQAYTGHQFGQLAPMLGDGRAVILGEWLDDDDRRWDIALKGSGRTPYSRGGDGKAALGPMLREVLISEAMAHLGIATTRSLAVIGTGEVVHRQHPEPGAILTRTAASHIRIGTFEYFMHGQDTASLKRLADYTLERHFPECANKKEPYLAMLDAVIEQQARLVAQWMSVGFIHGVMNTDNIALSGETIDYGPCAFMDAYHPDTVFSSIDRQGRYAYDNQPIIMQWNLARFAETLYPLLDGDHEQRIERLTQAVHTFQPQYEAAYLDRFRRKLGLLQTAHTGDGQLIQDWLWLLEQQSVDFTLAWRRLSDVLRDNEAELLKLFEDPTPVKFWLDRWEQRLLEDKNNDSSLSDSQRAEQMDQSNPIIIPRNHRVEEALSAASEEGDLSLFNALLEALKVPYQDTSQNQRYQQAAPAEFSQRYRTFCGT